MIARRIRCKLEIKDRGEDRHSGHLPAAYSDAQLSKKISVLVVC